MDRAWQSGRIGPAIGAVAIHALLGYALIAGLKVALPVRLAGDSLIVINLKPPSPPPQPQPEPPLKPRIPDKQGGAAPAPKAEPLPIITAPVPAPPIPPRLIPAPQIMTGGGGAGGGTGGIGTGQGSGGTGAGQGEGAGDGRGFTSARQIRGRFRNSDFPASAKGAGRLRIGVRYAVGPSGTVENCEIIQPSGYPEVDAMTCRVITERYRFRPARDGEGVPITEVLEEDYSWRVN
jgi:protein TonB